MSARSVVIALLLAAGLAGSAQAQNPPGPPWPVAVSPNGITLRWYPDELSEAQVHAVAAAHCAPGGRGAALVGEERDGSVMLGSYFCR